MKLIAVFFFLICTQLWSQDSRLESSFLRNDSLPTETNRIVRTITPLIPERILPIESYFRDRILSSDAVVVPTFPVFDSQVGYQAMVRDEKRRYSTFGHYLYNRELIELREDNNYLWITPLLDVSMGKNLVNDSLSRISQNTRGVRMEGSFNNRIFFSTSFYENQAILPDYASKYSLSRGEFYPQADSSYSQLNAVISGAARTKPFGTNGFDYAYGVGSVTIRLRDNMSVSWGNNSLFVGSGYRSMLWSDNSLGAMNLNFKWKLSEKWSFQVVRMRGMNMMRRIGGVNGEAYYEPTLLSMSTLYFHPSRNSSIGLFEGGMWYRGDSISKVAPSALYFVPIPGASTIEEATNGKSNTVLGLDGNIHLKTALIYGQFALNPFVEKSTLFQAGVRLHHPKLVGSWLQLEYNQADQNSYTSSNPRMNYASYNLPLAHPAGTNFQEFLVRSNYEKNHFFVSASFHYYPKQVEQSTLLPIYTSSVQTFQKVILTVIETGYKFNRAYGFEVFAQFRYRKSDGTAVSEASWISAGIRTAIRNHYYDY